MATIGATDLTLLDVARRTDGEGNVTPIVEMLQEMNPILQDAPAIECNRGGYHLTSMRTSLPTPTWRRINEGVDRTKSRTTQVKDTTALMEALSRIDEVIVDVPGISGGERAAIRLSEQVPHMMGMQNEAADKLFYGNVATDPEEIQGLAPRFGALTGVAQADQVVDASGSGSDNTSLWFMSWSPQTCHLIYPNGAPAGLEHVDHGKKLVQDSNSKDLFAYVDQYKWHLGLAVRDYRYVVRIANIDVSDLSVDASTGANLLQSMVTAYYKWEHRRNPMGRGVIYANGTVLEFLHQQARNANSNTQLTLTETGEGHGEVVRFLGIPIKEVDAIKDTEATVA